MATKAKSLATKKKVKKSPAKKVVKKVATKKSVKKVSVKKAATKKTPAKKTVVKKAVAKKAATMITLKKLDLFWLHSSCPVRVQIITLDAVIRAKLLYGMESTQLGETELKRVDQIHLKAMKK